MDGANTDTLMTTYFTSSKYVKQYIRAYGLPDIIEIRKIFDTKLEAKQWEERVIDKGKLHSAKNWLNCGNNGSFKNIVMDDDMKKKISSRKKILNSKKPKWSFYTDGVITKQFFDGEVIPDNFVRGKIVSEKMKKHVDHLQGIRENRTPEEWASIKIKISQSTKGTKKPEGFAEKISKAHKGLIKPHMFGDTNPSKTAEARRKISESWVNREKIYWFVNKETNEERCVRESELASVDMSVWKSGRPITGEWFNNDSESIWVRYDNLAVDRAQLKKGKLKCEVPLTWMTDGNTNLRVRADALIPDGFRIGKTQTVKAGEFKYFNDGITNITVKISQPAPEGFVPGKKKRVTHEVQQK